MPLMEGWENELYRKLCENGSGFVFEKGDLTAVGFSSKIVELGLGKIDPYLHGEQLTIFNPEEIVRKKNTR